MILRRLPVGAEAATGGTHFRVWAPGSKSASLRISPNAKEFDQTAKPIPLEKERSGYFSGFVPGACPGWVYMYQLDAGVYPDPASRFQPHGPHGPSQIVDPSSFQWSDQNWKGISRDGQVIYELHIGTFTRDGTWQSAMEQLPELSRIGITVIELMPVADFPGNFGWGYDGVDLFAPTRLYGQPDEFCAFVDRAHSLGLGVILDVVYNHLGPDGNYLKAFSADYFHKGQTTDWGDAINFDGENSEPVREFFLANAAYWIQEFHLDGLRLDATHQIFDSSKEHIIVAIVRSARQAAAGRSIFVVAENEPQKAKLVRTESQGGFGADALWNDDFHHTAIVALTGHSEAYFSDYKGSPQELISAAKGGFLFQGQWSHWQKQRRGSPALDLAPSNFVHYLESHDQVANSLHGWHLHQQSSPGQMRAMTALLLLGPQTPMLFQGQEFGSSAPFLYFADHHLELAQLVAHGRREFLQQFPSIACPETSSLLCDPCAEQTFLRCKLDFSEREINGQIYALHCDLLELRRRDPVIGKHTARNLDGAVLGPEAFALRFFSREHGDRLLIVNLGRQLHLAPGPEPLLAPVKDCNWQLLWSSEAAPYGGHGAAPLDRDGDWLLPGRAAVLFAARSSSPGLDEPRSNGKADSKN